MSKATNTKLMDTEPGGENTQYEGSATFVEPHKKSTGQFGANTEIQESEAAQQETGEKTARGEQTAENIRFGQKISEEGFGGKTVGNDGAAGEGKANEGSDARKAMGYEKGEGDGVGA